MKSGGLAANDRDSDFSMRNIVRSLAIGEGNIWGNRTDSKSLELVGILGHGEARYGLAGAFPFYFNAKDGGGFPAGGAKHGEGSQGFAIKARDEECLLAVRPFPHLTDLDLGNRHFRRVSK